MILTFPKVIGLQDYKSITFHCCEIPSWQLSGIKLFPQYHGTTRQVRFHICYYLVSFTKIIIRVFRKHTNLATLYSPIYYCQLCIPLYITANSVFPYILLPTLYSPIYYCQLCIPLYICSFPLYLHQNDVSKGEIRTQGVNEDHISRLHALLDRLIFNGRAKTNFCLHSCTAESEKFYWWCVPFPIFRGESVVSPSCTGLSDSKGVPDASRPDNRWTQLTPTESVRKDFLYLTCACDICQIR